MDSSTHISTHVDACGRGFLGLAEALPNTPRFEDQIRPESVKDEFDRFKIWAGNIAAHRKGRRSLEYRLRDAAHLKTETHNLLTALQDSLSNALAIVNGERTPWDELSDSETDSESDAELWDDANGHDIQGDTELKQLFASVKNTVTCLFRLSMAIRDPAPNSQSRSTITVDKSYFEEHDIQHVKAKFPVDSSFLTERLGRAISGRRQYLNYREQHHQKLAKNVEKIGFEEPRTEHTTNSTEASPLPKRAATPDDVLDDGDDALSQTSYATSVNATIRAPPLPKEAREREHFECPLCFMIVSIHTTAGWKQHIYRDLHPYSCTFEHCTTADRLYDSRHAWFKHELEAHRTSWLCIEGCEKTFHSEKDFRAHVQASHPDLAAPDMFSALRRTSAKSAILSEQTECPLCEKQMTLRVLQKHLGHHQKQLALFALPPNLDATEDDIQDEDASPVDMGKWRDEELSDISDSAEVDDLSAHDELPREREVDDGFIHPDTVDPPTPTDPSKPRTLASQPPLEQLDKITLELYNEVAPFCEAFITRPPKEKTQRDQKHQQLSQTVIQRILLKLDGVDTMGDSYARLRRKELVTDVQLLLTRMDNANAKPSSTTYPSEESINKKFSPSEWHGKFQGNPDFFAPNMQKGSSSKGGTSPGHGTPSQRTAAESGQLSEQSQPPPSPTADLAHSDPSLTGPSVKGFSQIFPGEDSDDVSPGKYVDKLMGRGRKRRLPKSILRTPTDKFPEDPNPIREGVAPHKRALKGKNEDIPPDARCTKIDRRLVNPEALKEAKERFEERLDCVIVLRVLNKQEIQKLADRTVEIRRAREDEYERRKAAAEAANKAERALDDAIAKPTAPNPSDTPFTTVFGKTNQSDRKLDFRVTIPTATPGNHMGSDDHKSPLPGRLEGSVHGGEGEEVQRQGREPQARDAEQEILKRLADFGFQENQIEAIIHSQQPKEGEDGSNTMRRNRLNDGLNEDVASKVTVAATPGLHTPPSLQPLDNALNDIFDRSGAAETLDPDLIAEIAEEAKELVLEDIKLSKGGALAPTPQETPQEYLPTDVGSGGLDEDVTSIHPIGGRLADTIAANSAGSTQAKRRAASAPENN